MPRFFRRILLSLVLMMFVCLSLVMVVTGFEYYARWHYRDVVQSAHGWDYFLKKSFKTYQAENNSLGYRGKEYKKKEQGVFRVVVIGDSFAWGQGVLPYTSRFPELTEQLLLQHAAGKKLEILNLGFPGRNLDHHLASLPTIFNLTPDFVLYQWFVNDVDKNPDIRAFHTMQIINNNALHQKLKTSYVTYILLHRAVNTLRTLFGMQKSYEQYLVDRFKDNENKESVWANTALNDLITRLQERGIGLGMVLFPEFATNMSTYKLDFLHDRVLETCSERNLPCLDLRETYSHYENQMQKLRVNPLDAHPSTLAHSIAAEKIVEKFGPLWETSNERPHGEVLMSSHRGNK